MKAIEGGRPKSEHGGSNSARPASSEDGKEKRYERSAWKLRIGTSKNSQTERLGETIIISVGLDLVSVDPRIGMYGKRSRRAKCAKIPTPAKPRSIEGTVEEIIETISENFL